MSEEKKYCEESIRPIQEPIEHVRRRPAMFIGRVDEIGNLRIISFLFECLKPHSDWFSASFTYLKNDTFQLVFDSVLNFELTPKNVNSVGYEMYILPALSETCSIQSNGKKLVYEQGILIAADEVEKTVELSITFRFDTAILRSQKLPEYLLLNFFKRYSFLYPEKEIHVFEDEKSIASFSSNGMQDWFDTQSFDAALLMKPFQISIEDTALDLKAEIMFSIHNGKEKFSTITLPRTDFVRENGSHATGFKKGLKNAVREILGETTHTFELTEYRNLIGVFKLSYPDIRFHGPTRDEVGCEELVGIFEKGTQETLLADSSFRNTILELFGAKGC
ncbi:hypothetical protein [uncultured Kordia sp.]|uniref:hypothetical protein n=1 Tax=uncultured Kordia sp. TaxID=507699 RepID=UPI00261F8515|nr:hypothetical protein [uncultured Kordia sp.]